VAAIDQWSKTGLRKDAMKIYQYKRVTQRRCHEKLPPVPKTEQRQFAMHPNNLLIELRIHNVIEHSSLP
jgi:hypothetical protein